MELQHNNPAWKHKANFIIGVKIEDEIWSEQYSFEQLAVREDSDGTYELCCIPFAVYDLSLGDYVTVNSSNNVTAVTKASNQIGFRIATKDKYQQQSLLNYLEKFKVYSEIFSEKLNVISTEDDSIAKEMAGLLNLLEFKQEIMEYETIRTKI